MVLFLLKVVVSWSIKAATLFFTLSKSLSVAIVAGSTMAIAMLFSLLNTHVVLVAVGSREATAITNLILNGGILLVCLLFLPGYALTLLCYFAYACFYLSIGVLGLLYLTCYYLFKLLCFTWDCLLSPCFSYMCGAMLAFDNGCDLFEVAMSRWMSAAQRTMQRWFSAQCRWVAATAGFAMRRLFSAVRSEGESSNSKPVFCGICMEFIPNAQVFQGLFKCNHLFCIDCMVQYIRSKIKDKIVPVECPDPNCRWAIKPEDCWPVFPRELLGRWEMTLFEASIAGFQKFYCPFKDCSAIMVDDGEEEVTQSECPHCQRMFCAKCRVVWHAGVTCREFQRLGKHERTLEDIMLMKLAKDKQWKRCSKCRYYVEKSEGCVHMTCRCGYEFCYRCGRKWSNTHAC